MQNSTIPILLERYRKPRWSKFIAHGLGGSPVQSYGAVWRYTFIIPHIQEQPPNDQEQKMGHDPNPDRIVYFEEATFEINHIDGTIKVTGPAIKDPLEEIEIPKCCTWLSVQVKRKYSAMNELYGLLKEAEKSYQSIISQLQSNKKTLSMLDIVRSEYAIVSKVVERLASNGVSYERSVKSAMEDRRSISLQESVFIQLNGDRLYTRI